MFTIERMRRRRGGRRRSRAKRRRGGGGPHNVIRLCTVQTVSKSEGSRCWFWLLLWRPGAWGPGALGHSRHCESEGGGGGWSKTKAKEEQPGACHERKQTLPRQHEKCKRRITCSRESRALKKVINAPHKSHKPPEWHHCKIDRSISFPLASFFWGCDKADPQATPSPWARNHLPHGVPLGITCYGSKHEKIACFLVMTSLLSSLANIQHWVFTPTGTVGPVGVLTHAQLFLKGLEKCRALESQSLQPVSGVKKHPNGPHWMKIASSNSSYQTALAHRTRFCRCVPESYIRF